MKLLPYVTSFMGLFYFIVETLRRGIGYFSINATTMVCAWAYATGAMFVPFSAHFEAWLRETTFRQDHPHDEIGIVILKGLILILSLVCLTISVRIRQSTERRSAVKLYPAG